MDIHEYQAKEILSQYGIVSPPFAIASTVEEAIKGAESLNLEKAVLKVQVHAGGRGKAGGVIIAKNPTEIKLAAKKLLGMKIINNQTGSKGVIANQILISPLIDIKKEFYISVVMDRKNGKAMMIATPEGGMDIEEVAAKHPDSILTFPITNIGEIRSYNLAHLLKFMGWKDDLAKQGTLLAKGLAKAFIEKDASLLEINPLVETNDGKLIALDAKISVDDNALFRQSSVARLYDPLQSTSEEVTAREYDLAYVALDGNIGCMVNGAGLAMATMDIIHLAGGAPANFLDVGGGANAEKIAAGFKIILSDPKVKAILVNIFGGIMSCETIAEGIIAAAATQKISVPLIVRMEGTNVENGKKILKDSKLDISIASTLTEAANQAVKGIKNQD